MTPRATVMCVLTVVLLATSASAETEGELAVRVRYLGASGLSIRLGSDHILTAPFFSNPGLWRVAFRRIAPDPARFPPDIDRLAVDSRAILVGHAHYDHLMDVPVVARHLPKTAAIYGSETAKHILAAVKDLPVPVIALNEMAGDFTRPGQWVVLDGGRIRFMALEAGHAPHFIGIRLYDGRYAKARKSLPKRAKGWKLGLPLSYVIDFLDPTGGQPVFRIYYQDAATNAPDGFPPPLADGKTYDLAVLCVASFEQVEQHPEAILEALRPRAVALTHWENFFEPQSEPFEAVPATDLDEFLRRLEAVLGETTSYWLPDPGESTSFPLVP